MIQDADSRHRPSATETSTASAARARPKRRKQHTLAWLEEPYNHTRGEMALWSAVIMQAMQDALNRTRNAEAIYHKNEAIHWLTSNSKDFHMVCLCAGFDPDYIRRNAKRSLLKPVAWRAEAGKGNRYLERKTYRQAKKNLPREQKSCEPNIDCAQPRVIILRNAFNRA
jgi:hypothetical protein